MTKTVSCGLAPIRKHNGKIEILLGKPINSGFYGVGFLKGQVEPGESEYEAALREFSEESGDLDVEIFDINTYFTQDNPKKKIHIWPAKVLNTDKNAHKIDSEGIIEEHDWENELIKFHNIEDLPVIFKNQQDILSELLKFIEENKENIN